MKYPKPSWEAVAVWVVVLISLSVGVWFGSTAFSVFSEVESNTQLVKVPYTTVVCGVIASPQVVLGFPVEFGEGFVRFEDGYVLMLDRVPSMYIGKLGFFKFEGGKLKDYAIVKKEFHPCPEVGG